jgi:hypothetical protein
VVVPDFVGMQALNAWLLGHDRGLLLAGPDPDGPGNLTHGRITAQRPGPGVRLPRWSVVHVSVADPDGGLGGVREPRRPPPPIHELAAEVSLDGD